METANLKVPKVRRRSPDRRASTYDVRMPGATCWEAILLGEASSVEVTDSVFGGEKGAPLL